MEIIDHNWVTLLPDEVERLFTEEREYAKAHNLTPTQSAKRAEYLVGIVEPIHAERKKRAHDIFREWLRERGVVEPEWMAFSVASQSNRLETTLRKRIPLLSLDRMGRWAKAVKENRIIRIVGRTQMRRAGIDTSRIVTAPPHLPYFDNIVHVPNGPTAVWLRLKGIPQVTV